MTEIIEISTDTTYATMWFFIGLFVGLLLCPLFIWLAKQVKEALEK
jgi:hypothetical protein